MVAPIMVFDSGSGGLSVLGAIKSVLPTLRYSYVADYAGVPYGDRDPKDISNRISGLVNRTNALRPHSAVVVACNTASTLSLPRLRSELDIPVIGVVPAIKPACEAFPGGRVLLLATPATVEGAYIDQLIADFSGQTVVERLGSSALVTLTEQALSGGDIGPQVAQELAAHADQHYDAVVLGCTHFPLIKSQLASSFEGATLIDSGEAIARRVASLLGSPSPGDGDQAVDNWFLFSQKPRISKDRLAAFDFDEHIGLSVTQD